jgi:SH3 domain-containing YSC84-like protein 1
MRKLISLLMVLALVALALPALAADNDRETDRLENAGSVMKEILNVPDDIPQDLLDKAECVIVFPSVLKAAFGIGGSYGRGAMVCRSGQHFTGPWGAPTMMALEGASFGFQIGGQATAILSSKVQLGAGMSAAAGPKGRDANASTDATLRAEILTYSRSRGLFAGISLNGSTLRPDDDANESIYGKKETAKQIIREGAVPVPPSGQELVSLLNKKSPKNLSDPESLK